MRCGDSKHALLWSFNLGSHYSNVSVEFRLFSFASYLAGLAGGEFTLFVLCRELILALVFSSFHARIGFFRGTLAYVHPRLHFMRGAR